MPLLVKLSDFETHPWVELLAIELTGPAEAVAGLLFNFEVVDPGQTKLSLTYVFDCHFTGPFLQELKRVVGVLNTK